MALNTLKLSELVKDIADILKEFDSERPIFKDFRPGIGPYGEPQLVKEISLRLNSKRGYKSLTKRNPDLEIDQTWAMEFKIVRPFGDNGKEAENWSVNLLHPYSGNTSLIGDAMKLQVLFPELRKCVLMIGYEHEPPKIPLEPLIRSYELITREIIGIRLCERNEEIRNHLVHPEHQIVRCIGWEIK